MLYTKGSLRSPKEEKIGFRRSEMKKAKWIVLLLAVALAAGLVATMAVSCGGGGGGGSTETTEGVTTTDNGQNYSFVVSLAMPSSASLFNTYITPWTQAVAASSNGRVAFDIKEANTLVKEDMQIDAVLNGTSDITAFQPDWATGTYPVEELSELPMIFPDETTAVKVTWDLMQQYATNEELKDFHVLGLMFISASQWGGKVAVHTPADFKGVRVRSGGGVETDTINALGGVPVETETMDLATALTRNMFDGLFLTWSFHAGNTNQWCTEWTKTDMFYRCLVLAMSKERWDSLPAAVQKAFDDNSGVDDSVKYCSDDVKYNLDNASMPGLRDRNLDFVAVQERAKKVGGTIYELSADEKAQWKAAVQKVLDGWVTKYASMVPSQEIMDKCNELIEQYAGPATTGTTAAAAETTTTAGQ
jgi:TRAP-type transport system periplasmic protein